MNITIPDEIKKQILAPNTFLCGFRGSVAHNMYIPGEDPDSIDDIDIMAIYVASENYYVGLGSCSEYNEAGAYERFINEWDSVSYEVRKLVRMLIKSNPNVISLLWLRDEFYIIKDPIAQLLIENRNIFSSKRAWESFHGYAKGQFHRMISPNDSGKGYMGAKRRKLVEKFGFDCYDDETTEFLTSNGWKKFDEVTNLDEIGTVRKDSGDFEFQNFLAKTDRIYSGFMYEISPYLTKCVVTPSHKLLLSRCHRQRSNGFSTKYKESAASWQLSSIEEINESRFSNFNYRRFVNPTNTELSEVSDSYLQLAGLYVSDGTANFRRHASKNVKLKSIRITQSKPENGFYALADKLTDIYNMRKYEYIKETVWVLHGETSDQIYKDFGHINKRLPKWCFRLSKRQTAILWESLLLGDGTKKEKYNVYYTSSKDLASDLQALLTISGIPVAVDGPYSCKTPYGISSQYHVVSSNVAQCIHTIDFSNMLKHGDTRRKKEGYVIKQHKVVNRRVVCFETPNGTIITRNSGKISIHGNCKNAAHLIRILRMGIEMLDTGVLNIYRTHDRDELLDIKKGKWALDEVIIESDKLFYELQRAGNGSPLPEDPDEEKAEKILKEIVKCYLTK